MQDQIALPQAKGRDVAVERSQKVSRALHDAARRARQTVRGATVWQGGYSRAKRGNRTFTILSAIAICIVPTFLFTIYISLFATDQFQTEARFAIKSKAMMLTDALGSLTGLASLQQAQDSHVIVEYIQSRALVEKLDRELDLRKMFSRDGIDALSRFKSGEPVEQLVKYWKKLVHVKVELPANIISLSVRAYSPEDSLKIAQAVVAASERLVNDLSDRSRRDAVVKAQQEVERAELQLASVREQSRQTRDREGLIDPKKSGDEFVRMLGELKMDRIKLEAEMQVGSRNLVPTAPQMQTLKAKLEAVNTQIAGVEKLMTSNRAGDANLADSYVRFDKSRLDQEWAEKFYQIVAGSLEKARIDAERQQVYLENFVSPVLPEEAEFPRRFYLISLVLAGSFFVWFLVNWVRSLVYA